MWLCGHYVQENAHEQSTSPELEKDWYTYFKKSKKEDQVNYRLVSLISVLVQVGNIFLGVYFQTHKGQEGNQKDSTQADHDSSSWLLSAAKITSSGDGEREVHTIHLGLLHFLTLWLSHTHLRVKEVRARRTHSQLCWKLFCWADSPEGTLPLLWSSAKYHNISSRLILFSIFINLSDKTEPSATLWTIINYFLAQSLPKTSKLRTGTTETSSCSTTSMKFGFWAD